MQLDNVSDIHSTFDQERVVKICNVLDFVPAASARTWLTSLTNPIVHQAALVVYLAEFQTFNVLV